MPTLAINGEAILLAKRALEAPETISHQEIERLAALVLSHRDRQFPVVDGQGRISAVGVQHPQGARNPIVRFYLPEGKFIALPIGRLALRQLVRESANLLGS